MLEYIKLISIFIVLIQFDKEVFQILVFKLNLIMKIHFGIEKETLVSHQAPHIITLL